MIEKPAVKMELEANIEQLDVGQHSDHLAASARAFAEKQQVTTSALAVPHEYSQTDQQRFLPAVVAVRSPANTVPTKGQWSFLYAEKGEI